MREETELMGHEVEGGLHPLEGQTYLRMTVDELTARREAVLGKCVGEPGG